MVLYKPSNSPITICRFSVGNTIKGLPFVEFITREYGGSNLSSIWLWEEELLDIEDDDELNDEVERVEDEPLVLEDKDVAVDEDKEDWDDEENEDWEDEDKDDREEEEAEVAEDSVSSVEDEPLVLDEKLDWEEEDEDDIENVLEDRDVVENEDEDDWVEEDPEDIILS